MFLLKGQSPSERSDGDTYLKEKKMFNMQCTVFDIQGKPAIENPVSVEH